MYRIQRDENTVKILSNRGGTVYEASLDSYLIYDGGKAVAKVRDLSDPDLLKALVSAVRIPEDLDKAKPQH
jgi:hypothetical protein